MRSILRALAVVLAVCSAANAAEPPRLKPAPGAAAREAFAWTSDGGLRYTWVLPLGYKAAEARDLIVICHGTGLDYRWGSANYKPGEFRPDDVVVSVDGPTEAQDGTRLFMGRGEDVAAVGRFIVEMRKAFAVKRVFLYGHSQGSFFAAHFAGEAPDLLDGVVAHASGVWTWTNIKGDVQNVPMVFLHGTADPVVPYGQSVGARDAYAKAGHTMVHLRRMAGYNHWPNAIRVSEAIDWCIGMRTDDPAEALAAAERMLAGKAADEYEYRCAVDYGGARAVLRRFEAGGMRAFAEVPEAVGAKAKALAARVDAEGAKHVAALSAQVKSGAELTLDRSAPWLGHLVAVREEFRGVEPVEKYVQELEYDRVVAEQAPAARPVYAAWYGDEGPKAAFEAVVGGLPDCFLIDGLPPGLAVKMKEWRDDAVKLGLGAEALAKYAVVERWKAGWDTGREAYGRLWKEWK
jgi:predicted esterase